MNIKDFYSKLDKVTNRYIDLMLVDANGNIDIIEVKKPFANALLSRNTYRGNHTPRIELAGSVMQAEKGRVSYEQVGSGRGASKYTRNAKVNFQLVSN